MSRTRAFYAVMQYVPDGGRAEAANAGVVLYVPETGAMLVRTSRSLSRIRKFFAPGEKDMQRIKLAVQAFETQMANSQGEFRSEIEFAKFVAARADRVRLTPPRLMVVSDLVTEFDELYAELVESGDAVSPTRRRPPLPPRVAEVFARLKPSGKVWTPKPIPLYATRRKLRVNAAFENGRVNYVLPHSLTAQERRPAQLNKLSVDGRLIYNHKIDDKDAKLVVVSARPGVTPEVEAEYAELLEEFHVRFVPFAENEAFAAEVERTAH
jgi:hypothetical protein